MLRRLAPLLVAAALVLGGCASADTRGARTPSAPAPSAQPVTTPTPTPTSADAIAIGVAAIEVTVDGQLQTYPFAEPEPLLAVVEQLTGEPAVGEDVEDPWGNGDVWGTRYVWDEISVSVPNEGTASVAVSAPAVGGIPVRTTGGIGVGASREDVVAAGGWDEWDADADGRADCLGMDAHPVEGTQSLGRPGEVGRQFVLVGLEGDVVTQIQSPSNDFSDI